MEQINTQGGAFVSGDVSIQGGDFIGRDKIVNNIHTFQERALTAIEEARLARDIQRQYLAEGISALAQALQAQAQRASLGASPYKGLAAYDLSDARLFYGRDAAIRGLLNQLGQGELTVLHAESGSGKTSLLQAGIAARLIAAGHLPVYLRPYDRNPSQVIKRAFLPNLESAPDLAKASLAEFLRQVSALLGGKQTLFIFLDQFEEFFKLVDKNDQHEFIHDLAECINEPGLDLRWVLALRAEYFSNLAMMEDQGIAPFQNAYRLNRLTREEAMQVITEPAAKRGLRFEPQLLEALLDDLQEDGEVSPVQLQLVCSALVEGVEAGQTISLATYDELCGAPGILGEYLKRQVASLPEELRPAARRVLRSMVTSDRRRAVRLFTELAAEMERHQINQPVLEDVLARLEERRLLAQQVIDESGRAYELVHDYLVNEIELDPQEQARKAAQELLDQETRNYERYQTLLTAERLALIEGYLGEIKQSESAEQLLAESRQAIAAEAAERKAQQERELRQAQALAEEQRLRAEQAQTLADEQKQRVSEQEQAARRLQARNRVISTVSLVALLAAVGAIIAAVVALNAQREAHTQAQNASDQARVARLGELSAVAIDQADSNLTLSSLLSVEAFLNQDTVQTRQSLFDAWQSTPQLVEYLHGHKLGIRMLDYSPDGQLASASVDGEVIIWDMATRQPAQVLNADNDEANTVAWSADGRLASSAADGKVIIWDLKQGAPAQILSAGIDSVAAALAWAPDGRLAAGYWDGTIVVWDPADEEHPTILDAYVLPGIMGVWDLDWSPDGLLAIGIDNQVVVWDGKSEKASWENSDPKGAWATGVAWEPDGHLTSVTWDGLIRSWDAETGQLLQEVSDPQARSIQSLDWAEDGRLAIGFVDGSLSIWEDGHQIHDLRGHSSSVLGVAWSPDGYLASASFDSTIAIWDVNRSTRGQVLVDRSASRNSGPISALAWSPDGLVAYASRDQVYVIDPHSETPPVQLSHEGSYVYAAAWSPDGQLATGDDKGKIIIWDLASAQPRHILSGHDALINALAWSQDGLLASASDDKRVIIWDALSGEAKKVLKDHQDIVQGLAWSPDGRLASVDWQQGILLVWDSKSDKILRSQTQVLGQYLSTAVMMNGVAWSPDGRLAVVDFNGTVIIFDPEKDEEPLTLHGSAYWSNALAWSPDGRLASGTQDGKVIVWDLIECVPAYVLEGHNSTVSALTWTPDGRLLSGSSDGRVILWQNDPQVWLNDTCQRAGRNLTDAEWQQYMSWKPYDENYRTCPEWP